MGDRLEKVGNEKTRGSSNLKVSSIKEVTVCKIMGARVSNQKKSKELLVFQNSKIWGCDGDDSQFCNY